MKLFSWLFDKIINPISEDIIHFIWFFFLLLAPSVVYWLKMPLDIMHVKSVILSVPICLWSSYVCCVISNFKYGSQYIRRIIYIILTLFAAIECYLLVFFGTRITEMIVQLVFETNSDEAAGFFQFYIFTRKFLFYIIGVIFFIVLNLITVKYSIHFRLPKFIKCAIISILILCGALNVWRDTRFIKLMLNDEVPSILSDIDGTVYSKNYTTIGRIIYSCRIYFILKTDLVRLENVLSDTYGLTSNYTSPKIVVIIGESFNKHHSNLYGYDILTNPYLTEELNKGNLYVFNDVCSPFNATYRCLKSFLSFESQDNNIYWVSDLLVPALFKKAGYYVQFVSNQEVKGENKDSWSFSNDYLTNPRISHYLFDYMNEESYQYDSDLVLATKDDIDFSKEYYLTLYHLMGQHSAYDQRYPKEYEVFTSADYDNRKDLNVEQKSIVATYDNATLYNDKVINDILDIYRDDEVVVIYFSDHGEEVYDFRNRVGRCHDEKIIPQRAKYEYSIPFMIWMSDKYKEAHPNIVHNVLCALELPFMIDDLPHLLIDISGIEYDAFVPSRSVINSSYNRDRQRLLENDKQNYDALIR